MSERKKERGHHSGTVLSYSSGAWSVVSGTGNTNGFYTNAVSSSPAMFYRVRQ